MKTDKLINLIKITLLLIPLFVISSEVLNINEISYGNDEKQRIVSKWTSEKYFFTFETIYGVSFRFLVDLEWVPEVKSMLKLLKSMILNKNRARFFHIFQICPYMGPFQGHNATVRHRTQQPRSSDAEQQAIASSYQHI